MITCSVFLWARNNKVSLRSPITYTGGLMVAMSGFTTALSQVRLIVHAAEPTYRDMWTINMCIYIYIR